MKIIIDDKICLKHGLTPNEVMLALAIRTGEMEEDISNMVARGILVEKGEYLVTQRWSDVLDEILADSTGKLEKTDEELLTLAKKMRELYPEGKMKDRFGRETPYYYRCNNSEIAKALKRFITQKGNYSDEDILDATKRYVASFQGQYWQKGMRLLKYFILKDEKKEGEDGIVRVIQVSDLETYLNNKEGGSEEVVNTSDDWLMNVIN